MNILVTGANGQLGNELRVIASCHSAFPCHSDPSACHSERSEESHSEESLRFIFTDVCDAHPESIEMLHKLAGEDVDITTSKLDITNLDAIRTMVKEKDIQVIVNCAAWTNVDGAEDPEKYALVELLNAKAPENLAIAMKEVNGLLVHISTDYVFGGDPYNTPCKEDQQGTPTGVYGLTKLHGEQAIQRVGCRFVILRTAWLYSEFGKNFVKTMLNLTATRPQLKVVFDQVGTPTYAKDLADAIVKIICHSESASCHSERPVCHSEHPCHSERSEESLCGIYHFSNEGVTSWYDFTKMISAYAGNDACDILPCHSDEFPSPVHRPAYSVLDKTKIKHTFGLQIPYWTESLKDCLKNLLAIK